MSSTTQERFFSKKDLRLLQWVFGELMRLGIIDYNDAQKSYDILVEDPFYIEDDEVKSLVDPFKQLQSEQTLAVVKSIEDQLLGLIVSLSKQDVDNATTKQYKSAQAQDYCHLIKTVFSPYIDKLSKQ